MDTKALRQKILDLAIRGKLVPQDPNDEPASVLLERIRQEKKKLVEEGKLKPKDIKKDTIIFKGEDNLHYEKFADGSVKCIEDEIPFELPERWAWVRLQSITSILTDGTHKTPTYSENGYIFLSSKNVTSGEIDWDNIMYIPESLHQELYNRLAPKKGDILLAKNGTTGIAAIVDKEEIFDIYVSLALIRIVENIINPLYVLKAIGSSHVQDYFNSSLKGIGVPNLHLEHIRKTLIPIPPYSEQERIVLKANMLLPLAEQIEADKRELGHLVSALKSQILDLAIRGKLVPQDPNDEPASFLLERIQTEKKELIKQGKIKCDKKESIIFKGEDNSYYDDIPDTWKWIYLSEITSLITKGTTPRGGNSAYSDSGIGFLRAENVIGYKELSCDKLKYISNEMHNGYLKRSILRAGDILITIAGTLGRTAIVLEKDLPLNTNQAVAIIRPIPTKDIDFEYIVYAINSSDIKNKLLLQKVETAIPNLSLENISNCKIPLPPLSEQKRIVIAIESAFKHINYILNNL